MILVVASGGFDPLHVGHLDYLQRAKALGDRLLVIVNSDEFLIRKKGYAFMPLAERMKVIKALACVDIVVSGIDKDQSVCETIRALCRSQMYPNIFANGGDRKVGGILEEETCKELGIRIVDGLGEKVQSSSNLVKRAREFTCAS